MNHSTYSFSNLCLYTSIMKTLVVLSVIFAVSTALISIPRPPFPHVVLDQDVISKYSEIAVIGDVHGCFDDMEKLLKKIHKGTNPDSVLKIFVGDLVNRGPKNREVIQYMSHPHLMAVRGNHDEKVIDQYLNHLNDLPKKLQWVKELKKEEIDFLINLPYTIHIPSLHSLIVHAGVIPGRKVQDMSPTDLTTMRNVFNDENGKLKASDRREKGEAWAKMYSGPDHIYFGHDAGRRLQKESFATGLDTGCVHRGALTAAFIHGKRKGELVKVKC